MASTSDMNIILGQGNAIKEIHNIRKDNLELNQPFVAQEGKGKKKEDKTKVQTHDTGNRVETEGNDERRGKQSPEEKEKRSKKKQSEEKDDLSEGRLIDIRI